VGVNAASIHLFTVIIFVSLWSLILPPSVDLFKINIFASASSVLMLPPLICAGFQLKQSQHKLNWLEGKQTIDEKLPLNQVKDSGE